MKKEAEVSLDNDSVLLMKYITVWGWQIISIIFFAASLLLLAIPRTVMSLTFFIVTLSLFFICEYICFKRRKELIEKH